MSSEEPQTTTVLVPGRNLVLIGLMGAGKTTVGHLLAERLGRPFVDTDAIIESEAGMTIREVFDTRGERAFRRLEAEAVRRVSALRGRVVAVGGGAVADPANRTSLGATGDLVWLEADPQTLAERVSGGVAARPMLDGSADVAGRLAELDARRAADFERAAALRVDTTGKSPEEIAETILDWAQRRPGLLAREERRPGRAGSPSRPRASASRCPPPPTTSSSARVCCRASPTSPACRRRSAASPS